MNNSDPTTDSHQQGTERIVSAALAEFTSKGIKAVKMDDIATLLSISKRTLYEHFENKEQLLLECVRFMANDERHHMDLFASGREVNVIAIVIEFYRYQLQKLGCVSPSFYTDMRKYPLVNEFIEQLRREKQQTGLQFFAKGKEEGYFRTDVDYALIAKVCGESMDYINRNHLLEGYSLKRVFQDVTMLYIRGLCTLKGIEALERELKMKN